MNFQVACDHNVDIFFIRFNVFSSHVLHLDVGSTLHIPGQKTNTAPRIKRNWSCSRPWRWGIVFWLYMIFFLESTMVPTFVKSGYEATLLHWWVFVPFLFRNCIHRRNSPPHTNLIISYELSISDSVLIFLAHTHSSLYIQYNLSKIITWQVLFLHRLPLGRSIFSLV